MLNMAVLEEHLIKTDIEKVDIKVLSYVPMYT